MRNKLLIAALLFAAPAFAQAPLNLETNQNGITQHWGAGGTINRGQIVKISGNQVVAVATTDTSGAIGVAITSATQNQDILISIMGSPLLQVDGACVAGNIISISNTNAGLGHCAATASGQSIATALSAVGSAGFVTGQLTVGGGGGSPTAVDGVIYAKDPAFGGKFDVRYESDCTFNTTTTIVCPSGHFTSADVGKIEFGTNALQQHGAGTVNAT